MSGSYNDVAYKHYAQGGHYEVQVAKGNIPGSEALFLIGKNRDINSGDNEDIINFNDTYTFLSSASTLYISSSNASDTNTFFIRLLDENWKQVDQTIQLQGQTSVALPGTYIRAILMFNTETPETSGDVYLSTSNTTSGGIPTNINTVQLYSNVDDQQSSMAVFTVPAGKVAYLSALVITGNRSSNNGDVDININTRNFGGPRRVRASVDLQINGQSGITYNLAYPLRFEEKTDIWISAISGANNTHVGAGYQLLLEDA